MHRSSLWALWAREYLSGTQIDHPTSKEHLEVGWRAESKHVGNVFVGPVNGLALLFTVKDWQIRKVD